MGFREDVGCGDVNHDAGKEGEIESDATLANQHVGTENGSRDAGEGVEDEEQLGLGRPAAVLDQKRDRVEAVTEGVNQQGEKNGVPE